jgi:hypothetical protein
MLNKAPPKYLPILSGQQLLNILPNPFILLPIPLLKKAHLTIKKRSMCLLTTLPISLSMHFTLS